MANELNALELIGVKESSYLPKTYKVGRDALLQLSKIERDLFTDIEERESGNYIISGLSQKVTELDLTAFSFAVGQILYNQSYTYGNTELNSGRKRYYSRKFSRILGERSYFGDIETSLNELCSLAYGTDKPSTEQRKAMSTLIDTIDSTSVNIQFPNGDTLESKLCVKMDKYTRKEDGSIFYNLHLNPIFCQSVKNNFAELPQDLTKRLSGATKKKTLAHYKLIRLLAIQDKRKPLIRTKEILLKELDMEKTYKKDKSRTEKQLTNLFESMVQIGILQRYTIAYGTNRGRKTLEKVTFYLNANFVREDLTPKS